MANRGKKSIFEEPVGVVDLAMFKMSNKEQPIDASDILAAGVDFSKSTFHVSFERGSTQLFKLSVDYDKGLKSAVVDSFKVIGEVSELLIAAALEKFVNENPELVSMRTGFGDASRLPEIFYSNPFSSLVRVVIYSGDRKSVAITKSVAKLQDCLIGSKFSLTRLT